MTKAAIERGILLFSKKFTAGRRLPEIIKAIKSEKTNSLICHNNPKARRKKIVNIIVFEDTSIL